MNRQNMKDINVGDMVGHMFFSGFSTKDTHLCTIIASMDGLLAVLPFIDMKLEIRKSPDALFKLYQTVSKHAMETFLYNLNGVDHN